jgi:hypothetical protein
MLREGTIFDAYEKRMFHGAVVPISLSRVVSGANVTLGGVPFFFGTVFSILIPIVYKNEKQF